jgi:NAD(P)H-flavin reductase
MQCAVGHCGHCQFGAQFLCKDGPVFNYPQIRDRLGVKGY